MSDRSLTRLVNRWKSRDIQVWRRNVRRYRELAYQARRQGEPMLAYDVAREGLGIFENDVKLRQVMGLALADSGALEAAISVLLELREHGHVNEETLGILGRCYKDLWQFDTALRYYSEAYEIDKGFWPGINAAALTLLQGEPDEARRLAREVDAALAKKRRKAYWIHATRGEAALIRGEQAKAIKHYRKAIAQPDCHVFDRSRTRGNARMIVRALGGSIDEIDRCFDVPNVAVFTGHMIDLPGRTPPRFPPELEQKVRDDIDAALARRNIGIGYCSVACGSDILFAEALLRRGAEVNVVLPYPQAEFIHDSVDIIKGANWRKRCERVLRKAAWVKTASKHSLNWGGLEYEYVNLFLQGLATVRAQHLDTGIAGIAVWNGAEGDGRGGTASVVRQWRKSRLDTEVIRLPRARTRTARNAPPLQSDFIMAGLFFADVVHFSTLTEDELPVFVREFLGLVATVADRSADPPIFRNTWGDGIYLVFPRPAAAGDFALTLLDQIHATDWGKKGIRTLDVRIGLHAGPVYRCHDPLTGNVNYTGGHVNRAARIEPITPEGHAYASEEFAALAAIDPRRSFDVRYVGQIGMAKNYGVYPTYALKKRRAAVATGR